MVTTRRAPGNRPPAQLTGTAAVAPATQGTRTNKPRAETFDGAEQKPAGQPLTSPSDGGALNFGAGKVIRQGINDTRVQALLGPYVPEEQFVARLAQSPAQAAVLGALIRNKEYKALWSWFSRFPGGNPIRFVVRPGLKMGGVERFGGLYTSDLALIINPAKREHLENPQELVNTLVHELVHAALAVQSEAKRRGLTIAPPPLPEGATDLFHDEEFRAQFGEPSPDKINYRNRPQARAWLEREYGDGDSNPDDEFIDVNRQTQRFVQRVVAENLAQTGIGHTTITGADLA